MTPLSVAEDAAAPCFSPEDRFYSCPVAEAGTPFAVAAYQWQSACSKPGRSVFLPARISALVEAAVYEVDAALHAREKYEADKLRKDR